MALHCFYVDDGLMGTDTIHEAIQLWKELQDLFKQGGFELKWWKSSEKEVLASIPEEMKDIKGEQEICYKDKYTKLLGVEWNLVFGSFCPVISYYGDDKPLTKRMIVSNIAHLFDILGCCSPAITQMKILLQCLWEHCLKWDEGVPREIERV